MKFFRNTSRFFGLVLSIAVLAVSNFNLVHADEIPDYRLQVSPPTLDLSLTPGSTSSDSFKVQNTGAKAYEFIVGVTPYSVSDNEYTPDYESSTEYNDIVNWVSFSQDRGTVAPGDEVEVTVTVRVPRDVPSGGQYAMVYVQMLDNADAQDGFNITATKRVGILLYSEIEGNTRKSAQIIENSIPTILFNPPVVASSTIKNTGNVHGKATYTFEVSSFFSGDVVYSNAVEPATLQVLPESSRYNTVSWEGAPHIGIFKVKQVVSIFNETSTVEKVVIICPIWFVIIVIILIAAIIYWLISESKKRGVKNSEAE